MFTTTTATRTTFKGYKFRRRTLDYRAAMRVDSRSVERWILASTCSVIFRHSVFACVCVRNVNIVRTEAALLCSHIVLLWFGLLWWVLSWRLGMDEKAILPPSIEINNNTANSFLLYDGPIILEFRWYFYQSQTFNFETIRHHNPNQRINNSFDRN